MRSSIGIRLLLLVVVVGCIFIGIGRMALSARASPASTHLLTLQKVIVLQNRPGGYDGCADTSIDRWNPASNYENQNLRVQFTSSGDTLSTLIRFDLSPIPADAHILSAVLSLDATSQQDDQDLVIAVYRLKKDWVPTEATWNQAAAGAPWDVPGANGLDTDRAHVDAVTIVASHTGWIEFDLTDLVDKWHRGAVSNDGVLLRGEGTGGPNGKALYSLVDSASGALDFRPKLTITYELGVTSTSTPTRTPTPSATPIGPTRTPTATPTLPLPPPIGTLVLQNGREGYAGTEDTFIDTFATNANFGASEQMELRAKHEKNLLIRFDLSPLASLPADATIQTAVLSLWCVNQGNTSPIEVNSYRLLRPWNEMQATWNQARAGDPWGQPGAFQFGVDRAPQTATTGVIDRPNMWLHLDWTFMVPYWQEHPSLNYGSVISGTGWAHVTYWFASSENATPEIRPRLVITYNIPTPTATPTSPFTATPTRTPSHTPTRTPTIVASSTATSTPAPTQTRTPTSTTTPVIVPDIYEPDNSCLQARVFVVNGPPQSHNFHDSDDVDWVAFSAQPGYVYYIETHHLAPHADTVLYLFRPDCTSLITSDNDSGVGYGSLITWPADGTDTFFVQVSPFSALNAGQDSDYQLSISRLLPGTTPTPTPTVARALWLPWIFKHH